MRIHTRTAGEPGLFVNSYLLETAGGVVLVDAGLLVSDATALAAEIAGRGRPLLAAFVTHAHPDHFNGLPLVAGPDVPVYATAAVAGTIARIAGPKREQWQPVYGDEWPGSYRVPDRPLDGGGTVEIDGLRIEVRDLGPAESHADSYLLAGDDDRRVAFIGDLAFNGMHAYLADGHTTRWLTTLEALSGELAGYELLPGHGAPGDVRMLDDQRRYLLAYRETVARLADGKDSLDDEQKAELTTVMSGLLPGAPLSWLVALGADPVAAELAAA